MRRILRWFLNGLTALSLLLCVATAASWERSYWRWDWLRLDHAASENTWILTAPRGHLVTEHWVWVGPRDPTAPAAWAYKSFPAADAGWQGEQFMGFGYGEPRPGGFGLDRNFMIPHAFLVGLFGLLPAVRGYGRWRRGRAVPAGHCPSCGYDLRASPDRCPECGTIPTKT